MIADARIEHQSILSRLMLGPGDSEGAMHRAETIFGLSYWSQWNLRHKRPASPTFIQRVREVYLMTLEQSVRRDLEKLRIEQARRCDATLDADLVAEAETLLARIAERRVKA